MRLNDVNAALLQVEREAAHLHQRVAIIKTGQAIFGYVCQPHLLHFIEQRPRLIHAGEMNLVLIALFEQPRELHGLALRAALMKAANQL